MYCQECGYKFEDGQTCPNCDSAVPKDETPEVICYCDGGSKNNQGKDRRAYGSFKIGFDDPTSSEFGNVTNNAAEYMALCNCLHTIKKRGIKKAIVYSDSELVLNQISGKYQVNNKSLMFLYTKALSYLLEMPNVRLEKAPREVLVEKLGH